MRLESRSLLGVNESLDSVTSQQLSLARVSLTCLENSVAARHDLLGNAIELTNKLLHLGVILLQNKNNRSDL